MADSEFIKLALSDLDHSNDEHWTSDGLPRVDVIRKIAGDDSITRRQITEVAPMFARETGEQATEEAPQEPTLQEQIKAAEAEEQAARRELFAAKRAYDAAQKRADQLRSRLNGSPKDRARRSAEATRAYIERSNQQRAEAVEAARRLTAATGIPAGAPSQIDHALQSRKRQQPTLPRK